MSSYQGHEIVCQSCGMPLLHPEDYGTETDGQQTATYCTHCYQNGVFTDPDMTVDQMMDKCAEITSRQGMMSVSDAREIMKQVIPGLKRWREQA